MMKSRRLWRRATPLLTAGALVLAVAACSSSGGDNASQSEASASAPAASASAGNPTGTLRLGYFPNLTHAPALFGTGQGTLATDLGSGVKLEQKTFNSGTQESEAILSGAIDAGYIGPNPAINLFTKSNGQEIRIISGVTLGGAGLVVKPDITSAAQLKGKTLATPGLGNTQDVALRYYLQQQGLKTDVNGGGDVNIRPQDNSVTVDAFRSGGIDGAWVPEPTLSTLVAAGGKVLVDEASQWPGGKFPTTLLVVRTDYLKKNPEIVKRLVKANLDAINALNADPTKGQTAVNAALLKLSGKQLKPNVIGPAWKRLTFTADPAASAFFTAADHAVSLGLVKKKSLDGIFDLTALNSLLSADGKPAVATQ
jgi:NitT/TauT family transport system substrate-binding protein